MKNGRASTHHLINYYMERIASNATVEPDEDLIQAFVQLRRHIAQF